MTSTREVVFELLFSVVCWCCCSFSSFTLGCLKIYEIYEFCKVYNNFWIKIVILDSNNNRFVLNRDLSIIDVSLLSYYYTSFIELINCYIKSSIIISPNFNYNKIILLNLI